MLGTLGVIGAGTTATVVVVRRRRRSSSSSDDDDDDDVASNTAIITPPPEPPAEELCEFGFTPNADGECEQIVCESDFTLNAAGDACEPCPVGSSGLACGACDPGYMRNAADTACDACPSRSTGDGTHCDVCFTNHVRNAEGVCACPPGHAGSACTECLPDYKRNDENTACVPCELGTAGVNCTDCADDYERNDEGACMLKCVPEPGICNCLNVGGQCVSVIQASVLTTNDAGTISMPSPPNGQNATYLALLRADLERVDFRANIRRNDVKASHVHELATQMQRALQMGYDVKIEWAEQPMTKQDGSSAGVDPGASALVTELQQKSGGWVMVTTRPSKMQVSWHGGYNRKTRPVTITLIR